MCVIYDLSYLEMTLNVDELDILDIAVGQKAEITADAIDDQTFEGVVTSISSAGTTTGGTTTYPVTIRIDDTGSLMPGMNATAVIDIASAEDALSIPSYAVVRGNYVLVTKDSPSAVNADTSMNAPDGYVYVKVTTGISDDDYIAVTSGLEEGDTIAYDSASASKSSSDEQMGFPGQQNVRWRRSRRRQQSTGRWLLMSALIEFDSVCKYYQMGDTLVKAADPRLLPNKQG